MQKEKRCIVEYRKSLGGGRRYRRVCGSGMSTLGNSIENKQEKVDFQK